MFGLRIKKANKTTEFTNSSVSEILASEAVGKDILDRDHANNAAAVAAGLKAGDLYHTSGALKVVTA
tara:strand:- start:301 stop:501 length:201 start_codon:yes stop_codon:yes gene_type:complete